MSLRCDVLVVGGGGAGLRAAIAAAEANPRLEVTLVTKGALGKSGVTATACSDRMAFHAALPTTAFRAARGGAHPPAPRRSDNHVGLGQRWPRLG